jgi:hypothetical protein
MASAACEHRLERRPVDVHVVGGHRVDDGARLAVLLQELDAQFEVRAAEVTVDGLADVVQERGTRGDAGVEPDLAGHDARHEGHLAGMVEHVLAVARPELQPSHRPRDLGVEVEEAELERGGLALLLHRLLHLGLDLLDHFLDPGRMDAAIGDQPLDRLTGDFAPERIEAREDDGPRRVVDDELDARGLLERADVASLAADDPALHVVAGQIDHRHGRLDGVFGGAALDGLRHDLPRPGARRLARLGLEPLDEVRGIAARVGLELLEQPLARLVGGQRGDTLEFALLVGHQGLD